MKRLPQTAFPLAVYQPYDALPRDERSLQQALGGLHGLVGAHPVQIGFRHVRAGFGLEQQGVELVERRERRHVVIIAAFVRWAG